MDERERDRGEEELAYFLARQQRPWPMAKGDTASVMCIEDTDTLLPVAVVVCGGGGGAAAGNAAVGAAAVCSPA